MYKVTFQEVIGVGRASVYNGIHEVPIVPRIGETFSIWNDTTGWLHGIVTMVGQTIVPPESKNALTLAGSTIILNFRRLG
jgi:hypothetical protein